MSSENDKGGYGSDDNVGHITVRYGVELQKVAASGDLARMRQEAQQTRSALDAVERGGGARGGGNSVPDDKIKEVRSALEALEQAIKDAEA